LKSNELIIFSDLDGTLLDYDTYSFRPARQALELIKSYQIPLILVSSKTRFELIDYQKRLKLLSLPFVVENGSAVFTAKNYFTLSAKKEIRKEHDCYVLGKPYQQIVKILHEISQEHGYNIRGFHNAGEDEVRDKTNLPGVAMRQALKREFSVPLFFDDEAEKILHEEVKRYDLRILFGGRFMHLLGDTDKGKAVDLIKKGFAKRSSNITFKSVAIGDSLNDFAMLKVADVAILVKRHDGSYENRQYLKHVIYSPGIGPTGWNQSLLELLKKGGENE
jgi:mannosyl-3-phosphoglycerate phosphatase